MIVTKRKTQEKLQGYFTCPLASNENPERVKELILFIESLGFVILDRHVMGADHEEKKRIFCQLAGIDPKYYNSVNVRLQDLAWVMQSQFMICDVTLGSYGGGIEFDHATAIRRLSGLDETPILCLLEADKKDSLLISGCVDEFEAAIPFDWYNPKFEKVTLRRYQNLHQAKELIKEFLLSIVC